MKNYWLDKKTKKKFKGKFQEASAVQKSGRIYTMKEPEVSIIEEKDGRRIYSVDVSQHPNPEEFLKKLQEQFKKKTVEERWLPPTNDECGWFPTRPKEGL